MTIATACSLEDPVERSRPLRSCFNMLIAPHNEFSKCLEYIQTVPERVAEEHCLSLRGRFNAHGTCATLNRVARCSVAQVNLLSGELVDIRYVANFYSGNCTTDFFGEEQCGENPDSLECLDGEEPSRVPIPDPVPLPSG